MLDYSLNYVRKRKAVSKFSVNVIGRLPLVTHCTLVLYPKGRVLVDPPSTLRIAPVTHEAAGDTK